MTKKNANTSQSNNQNTKESQNDSNKKITKYISKKWFPPVLFLFLSLLYFSPYLSLNKIIMGTDDGPRGWNTYGNRGHALESFFDKWSPLNGGSAMMERRFGRFVNPSHFFHVILPKYKARTLEYIFWTFVAGFLMFIFLRNLGISFLASYLCGIAFMFAPAFQSYIFGGHFARMQVIALMPGVMFFTERMIKKTSLINIVGLPVMIALCVYSEHLQLAYFTFAGMAFYFAIRMIHLVFIKKGILLREGINRTLFFALAIFIGCMLTTMNIFPSMHHTNVTSKRAGGVDYEYASSFNLHPEEIFTLIEPDFIGWKEYYWGQNPLKFNSEYFGVIFLILAIMLFIFRKQNFKKYLFAGFFLFAVLFSLGNHTPVHLLFYHMLPGMKSFRAPSFMYVWFFLTGITLAAYALDELVKYQWKDNPGTSKRLLIFACIVGGIAFLYMISSGAFANFWYNSLFPAELQSKNKYNALMHHMKHIKVGAVITFFVIIAFLSIAYLKTRGMIDQKLFITLLLVIVFIDLARISRPFLTQCIKPKNYFDRQEKVEHSIERYLHQKDKTIFRVHSMLGGEKMYIPGLDMTYIFDDFINQRYHDIIQILRSTSHALQQPQYAKNIGIQSRFRNTLSLLNTKYVLTLAPLNISGLREVINSGGLRIYENLYSLPRFYLADNVAPESDTKQAVVKEIDSPLFLKNKVIVNKDIWGDKTLSSSIDSTIVNKVTVIEYNTRKGYAKVKVESNREQFLAVSENNNASWKATIDKKPVEIIPVNYIAKGVIVPTGSSEVEFIYNSPIAEFWRKATAITAILFLIFSICVGFIEIKKLQHS